MRTFRKIFCIGLNKTGTTSLHAAFGVLGLRSLHRAPRLVPFSSKHYQIEASRIETAMRNAFESGGPLLAGIDNYDAYSDIRTIEAYFPDLDRQ